MSLAGMNRPALCRSLAPALGLVLCVAAPAWAEGAAEQQGRESLRGLPGLEVIVDELSPDVQDAGLRPSEIEEAARERLRKGGVPLLGRKDRLKTAPAAALIIRVNTLHDKIGRYFLCVELELRQRVRLMRDEEAQVTAVTWSPPALITAVPDDNLKQIRDIVARKADQFAKDYAAVNGK
jgi:hypothetical protein